MRVHFLGGNNESSCAHLAAEATATSVFILKRENKPDAARNAVGVCVLLAKLTCKVEREKTEGLEKRERRAEEQKSKGGGGPCV